MLAVREGVFDRENAAPRVTEQVEVVLVEPERDPDLLDLVDEARDRPQRRIRGLVGVRRAELVVVDELDTLAGERGLERFEVLVGRRRPTM